MAATQTENQQNDMSCESLLPDQNSETRNNVLPNGQDGDRNVVTGDSALYTKGKSPVDNEMSLYSESNSQASSGILAADRDDSVYGQYARYPDANAVTDPLDCRASKPSVMSSVRPPQRYLSGQSISQPTGPTPTLNSLLQSQTGVAQPHRYLNSYEQSSYGSQGWVPLPPRPYNPQVVASVQPYKNTSPVASRCAPLPFAGSVVGAKTPPSSIGYLAQPAVSIAGAAQPYAPYTQQRYPATTHSPQQRLQYPPPHQYGDVQRWPSSGAPSPSGSPVSGGGNSSTGPSPPISQNQQYSPEKPPMSPVLSPSHQETAGQNSNDSTSGGCGVGGAGTPTSQGMRPTPSPTGSSGSRSMSPAVGQQNVPMPPRPSSSNQLDSQQQQRPQSPSQQSPVQQQQAATSLRGATHPHTVQQQGTYSYKMAASQPQSMPPYAPQQYPQGNYSPRPQYAPGTYGASQGGTQVPNNNMSNPGQYPSRPVPNHAQFPGYQNWNQSGQMSAQQSQSSSSNIHGNHVAPGAPGSKSIAPGGAIPSASTVNSGGSPARPHYLKQHLQHKMGFSTVTSSSPPQGGYGIGSNGPGMGPPGATGSLPQQQASMAPPQSQHQMGPPSMMGPPNMGPPSNSSPAHGGSENAPGPMPPPIVDGSGAGPQDNGISSSAASHLQHHHPVTSLVTTGPDGQPMDEASQQSTLSNASAASGEDPQCSSQKPRKGGGELGPYSHPPLTPSNASPGTQHGHEDYELCSPSWPRTPASSPIYNSHIPQENYRSKKSDSLSKLYDMDDCPDRRLWLDKLLGFMDERRTPISACPTISKQPLDLYRLYLLVRERGGFVEVTKNKTWKDIAGLLGIGASSSAAYTLRKHYTKNLLTFECHFDRGGIDPGPIIQQVEAGSKKKSAKAVSVPSPGSSNSQDSFPAPGSTGASLDGYGGYSSGYSLTTGPDYNSSNISRPPSQTNSQLPHSGIQQSGSYQAQQGTYGVSYSGPPDQYGTASGAPGQYSSGPPSQFSSGNRPVYQQYGPESVDNRNQYNTTPSGASTPPATAQSGSGDPYRSYASNTGNYPPPRPYSQPGSGSQTNSGTPGPPTVSSVNSQSATASTQGTPGGAASVYQSPPSNTQDYFRQTPSDQAYGNPAPGPPGSKAMPPPVATQPRRHPDFAKDAQQPYAPYQHRPQMYPSWPNNTGQYRGQYSQQNASTSQQWNNASSRPPGAQPGSQWDQHRYPSGVQLPYQPPQQQGQQQWPPMSAPGSAQNSPLRPAQRPPFRPDGKGAYMPPLPQQSKPGSAVGTYPPSTTVKKELVFPLDSVEAAQPILYRRKKLCRGDVAPVEAWRIVMALRSGLLVETCWALDILNILLYDDSSVAYFGLVHMPQLLELLLEHFQKSLRDVFDTAKDSKDTFKLSSIDKTEDCDLGTMKPTCKVDPDDKELFLKNNTTNYSLVSRKGVSVTIEDNDDEIFVTDTVKEWDIQGDDSSFNSLILHGTDSWQTGQSELLSRDYIIDCFQAEFINIPFACQMKSTSNSSVCNGEVIRTKNIESNDVSIKTNMDKLDIIESVMKKDDVVNIKLTDDLAEINVVSLESKFLECNVNVRDPAGTLKRRRMSDYEDECYTRDESSLYLVTESQDAIARRCVCISTILRNLTFVPGNEMVFAKCNTFIALLGKLLLLHHEHPARTYKTKNYDREEDFDYTDSCSSLQGENEWWWDYLVHIRENILVATSNIAGYMDLGILDEEICRPVLDGLLHWAICPSAQGQDPFPTVGPSSLLSPQRLALEALCKLCVTDANVDLVIATPPFSRLERLCTVLTRHLCRSEDQVLREFSVNLLHYLAAADSVMARAVASQNPCISLLVAFIEQAEQTALGVANQHGIAMLRDNPESMGTSLDMLRRAAGTLLHLARHPDNRPLFMQQEQRLLGLVMSQILDQQVAAIISRVLFQCSAST